MDTATALALLSTLVAALIAVVVPWLAFNLALRQDHTRWLREQRAEVYVDLLTEAYAEQQWLELDMAAPRKLARAWLRTFRIFAFHRWSVPASGFEPRCSRARRSTGSSTGSQLRPSGVAA